MVLIRWSSLIAVLLFAFYGFAETESTECGKDGQECPIEDDVVVTGENPDEDYDQYNECMRYLNDDRMCSGGAVGVNEPVKPTGFEQEAPMINYDDAYSSFPVCGQGERLEITWSSKDALEPTYHCRKLDSWPDCDHVVFAAWGLISSSARQAGMRITFAAGSTALGGATSGTLGISLGLWVVNSGAMYCALAEIENF